MVLIQNKNIIIFELTVPFEQNLESSHQRKCDKYCSLANDLKDLGYTVNLICFEIGARGLLTTSNRQKLQKILSLLKLGKLPKKFTDTLIKTTLSTSYSVYCARREPVWNVEGLLAL